MSDFKEIYVQFLLICGRGVLDVFPSDCALPHPPGLSYVPNTLQYFIAERILFSHL